MFCLHEHIFIKVLVKYMHLQNRIAKVAKVSGAIFKTKIMANVLMCSFSGNEQASNIQFCIGFQHGRSISLFRKTLIPTVSKNGELCIQL